MASGCSSGFVSGPLEVGNSTAIASITQTVGEAAKIESKTFGQFSVNGQEFGFDQNGFKYAGQGQDSKEAISQANSALKNAGIQIDLAPVITDKDETGKTTYTIGGLLITTTQTSPSGSGGVFQITYILGRAKVGAAVERTRLRQVRRQSTPAPARLQHRRSTDSATTDSAASGLDAAALPADIAAAGAAVPTNVSTITGTGAIAPVTDAAQVAGATRHRRRASASPPNPARPVTAANGSTPC